MQRRTRRLLAALTAANFAAAGVSHAEPAEVPIRVELNPTADCPSLDTFYERVAERSTHVRRARNGELGWSVQVVVTAARQRRLARMTIKATEGEWIERELLAPDCSDALEALAVVLAVLIDTAVDQNVASTTHRPTPDPDRPTTPIALPRVTTGVYIPWIDDPDFFEKRGVSLGASRIVPSVVVSTELDTQLSSQWGMGLGFGFELERWSANSLRPRFGLGLGWATADLSQDDIHTTQQRLSLRAHLCPFDLLRSSYLGLRPCVRLDAGYVYTRIEQGIPDQDRRRGMLRASPYLEFVFTPQADIELRLDGGVDIMAVRNHLVLEDYSQTRRLTFVPPTPGVHAALGVAVKY